MGISTYRLQFLKGTSEFVLKELLEKYPKANILENDGLRISFSCEENNIEAFRNLYSPIHIEDSTGRILNLSRRHWRKGFVPAGINPSLAYILCMVAKLNPEDILLDPFCGSSVIPITALKYFKIKRVIYSDISGKAIYASRENFEAAGIEENRYKLFRSDIRDVNLSKRNIDKIVSNLPFGIRAPTLGRGGIVPTPPSATPSLDHTEFLVDGFKTKKQNREGVALIPPSHTRVTTRNPYFPLPFSNNLVILNYVQF